MSTRTTLTREDWIQAAQRILIKGGIDNVRVDTLAKELKITRGSFYYHFKSRDELLQSLLADWRARATEAVIQLLSDTHHTAHERLKHLLCLPFTWGPAREMGAYEIAIRAWARRDPLARQAMDEVDNHRLRYKENLLLQMGYETKQAQDTAMLIYAYLLSISSVLPSTSCEKRYEQHLRIIQQWLQPSHNNKDKT